MVKKLDTSPTRPMTLTKVPSPVGPPAAEGASSASMSGFADSWIVEAPAPPGPKVSSRAASASRTRIPPMSPFGTSRTGSRASSAASGTPSIARKNHMA